MNATLESAPPVTVSESPDASGELSQFIAQVAGFFGCDSLTRVEWTQANHVQLARHAATGGAPAIQETCAVTGVAMLPAADASVAGLFNLGSLALLSDAEIGAALGEIHRVSAGNVWITLMPAPGRDRAWWEQQVFAAGFRPHPEATNPSPAKLSGQSGDPVILVLQKSPAEAQPAAALRLVPAAGPVTILALTADPKHPLFSSWLKDTPYRVEFTAAPHVGFEIPPHIDLVVGVDCYHEPWVTLLRKAVDAGIPTLILADGILEYRNTWEHPQLVPGALFQPVLGHKIACLGRSQARIIESWGNPTQCEVIGAPRFDALAGKKRRERPAAAPFRVLVMTAMTPYFTDEHHRLVRQSLLDLRAAFKRGVTIDGLRVEPVWRLTKGLDREIGVDTHVTDLTGRPMAEVLQNVDAVITTPSTAMLEAMRLGLPVAALDYCNVPAYVQPSWRISAADHIAPTLRELVNPPAPKILFQETTLHDSLECASPAAPRLRELASRMIAAGRVARAAGRPLELAARLVEIGAPGHHFVSAKIYPNHAPFQETDLSALQVEVGHLRRYAAALEQGRPAPRENPASGALTIVWKSKLEAALVLAGLQQKPAALKLMLEGIKAVEASPDPVVTIEALIGICTHLRALDAGRARYLLELAVKLAERLGQGALRDRARTLLVELPASVAA